MKSTNLSGRRNLRGALSLMCLGNAPRYLAFLFKSWRTRHLDEGRVGGSGSFSHFNISPTTRAHNLHYRRRRHPKVVPFPAEIPNRNASLAHVRVEHKQPDVPLKRVHQVTLHHLNLAGHIPLLPSKSQFNFNASASPRVFCSCWRRHTLGAIPVRGQARRPYNITDSGDKILVHPKVFSMQSPHVARSQLGCEVGLGEPSQDVLRQVLLLLEHEPMTCTLVVDNLGLREELLDQTNTCFGAGTVCSSTEEDNWNLDRISRREVTGWNFKLVHLCRSKRGVRLPFSSSNRSLVVR